MIAAGSWALLLSEAADPPRTHVTDQVSSVLLDDLGSAAVAVVRLGPDARARAVVRGNKDGEKRVELPSAPPVFDGLGVHIEVLAAVRDAGGRATTEPYPIALVHRPAGPETGLAIFVHGGASLTAGSRIYKRLTVLGVEATEADVRRVVAGAWAEAVNWDDGFRTFAAETEFEQKLLLTAAAPSPWNLALPFARLVRDCRLPNLFLEPGNDLHQWSFANYMFEVSGPDTDAGYASVLDDGSGSYLIKRKWFAEDALARQEAISAPLEIPDRDFAAAILARYPGLDLRPLPRFVRSRVDVHVVSQVTGNIFAVIFDRVEVEGHPTVLRQVEVEYLRTYRHETAPDEKSLTADLQKLADGVGGYLDSRATEWSRTTLSKLTFLRNLPVPARSGGAG